MGLQGGVSGFLASLYHDPFRWSLVKSIGLFALGVRVAHECVGLELMSNVGVPALP